MQKMAKPERASGSQYDPRESAERYDPRERFWVWLPSMSSKRGCYTLTVFGGTLYDMGRALLAIYLNVPWDPGGTDGQNIQAIAWGHAMFRGGGIVTPDTIRYMGPVVSDFRLCCFGLQAPSSSYKGEKQQIEKNKKNIPEQRRGQGSRALSDYGDHLIILCDLLMSAVRSRHGQRVVTKVVLFVACK
jgi:hypothetical protein